MRNIIARAKAKIEKDCDVRGFHVVAMALRGGNVIATETNRWSDAGRVSPWTEHAEERLVRKLIRCNAHNRFRRQLDILVLRIGGHDRSSLRCAKPCERCQLLLEAIGVRSIQFSDSDGRIKRV